MRILIASTWIPYPAQSGARIRVWEIARRLAAHHDVTFALHTRWAEDLEYVEEIRKLGFPVLHGPIDSRVRMLGHQAREWLRRGAPISALRRSRTLESRIEEASAQHPFDVLQMEQGELLRYPWQLRLPNRPKLTITLYDILSEAHSRMVSCESFPHGKAWRRWNAGGFGRMERQLLPQYDRVFTVSQRDSNLLNAIVDPQALTVVPNAVDTQSIQMLGPSTELHPTLLFVGQMEYAPNVQAANWLIEEIFPRLQSQRPDAQLIIIGNRRFLPLQKNLPGIQFPGIVPDLTPYYQRAHIAVAPILSGGGTRLKILEAMAYGRPVVATSLGAEGIDAQHRTHLRIANSAGTFASNILELLERPRTCENLAANARQLVESRYDWDQSAEIQLRSLDRFHVAKTAAA